MVALQCRIQQVEGELERDWTNLDAALQKLEQAQETGEKSKIETMGVLDKALRTDLGRRASWQNHRLGVRPQKLQDPVVEAACMGGGSNYEGGAPEGNKGGIDVTEAQLLA